jgi:rod shape determining protein RodA
MKRTPGEWAVLRRVSPVMTGAIALLAGIGMLFVYSAAGAGDDASGGELCRRQAVWFATGAAAYVLFAAFDYRRLASLSWWAYGASLILLVAVLLVGRKIYGARRWLMVFDVGIQPSEFAKLGTVLVLASVMGKPGFHLERFGTVAAMAAVSLVPMALIMKEPDLGTAMIFVPVTFVMMFVAGLPLRIVGLFAAAAGAALALLLAAIFLPAKLGMDEASQAKFQRLTGLSDYQKERIVTFLFPGSDPLGTGWNKKQSEIAVGSGGILGKGFRKGTQNILGFLPRTVAPTDFIYSVIAEETGFLGSAAVLFLFGVVMVSGMRTALAARDRMGRLLCAGMVTLVFSHAFINIAMTIGLMPVTGLPLPLLSYGGSFMIVTMSALGIVQSVRVRSSPAVTLLAGLEPA